MLEARVAIRRGHHWALKSDFANNFASIDRSILELELRILLSDQDLCSLIMLATSPDHCDRKGRYHLRLHGLPMGTGLSPVLANVYAQQIDLARRRFDTRTHEGRVVAFRLATSVANCPDGTQAEGGKTKIRDLYRESVVFLGHGLRGGNIYPSPKVILSFKGQI